MRDSRRGLGGCLFACGCAAGSMMIKAPVQQQCAGYGLKGCGELVDGVILYVDGDKAGAVHKLKEAAAQNSPAQLRPFAQALKGIVPGEAGAEIAEVLSGDIAPDKGEQAPNAAASSAPAVAANSPAAPVGPAAKVAVLDVSRTSARMDNVELALVAPVDPSRLITETASPRTAGPVQSGCDLLGSNGMCTTRPPGGPIVITDAVTPAACKSELFVGGADMEGKLGWFAQTNYPGIHGARFLLRSDQWLEFVARGVPTNKELDARCVITWAGFRPRIVPLSLAPSAE